MMNIVVVGGGAGGLELATSLGRKLGKKNKARITLVDRNRTHLWKPLLHEVATGSMDAGIDALSYQSHAKNHGFEFQLGSLTDIKRDEKRIVLAPIHDESGALVVNEREVAYDILVMAIGSVSNDFNTKGIKDHCIFLDSPSQAHRFYNSMMNRFLQFATEYQPGDKVKIAIDRGRGGPDAVDQEEAAERRGRHRRRTTVDAVGAFGDRAPGRRPARHHRRRAGCAGG